MLRHRAIPTVATVGALLLAACGGGDATAPSPAPTPTPVVAAVHVTPASASLAEGLTMPLTAAAKDNSGQPLSRSFAWSSSAPSIAAVDGNGTITAVTAGQASITATADGKSASAAITVTAVPVASIEVNPVQVAVVLSRSMNATAIVKDSAGRVLARVVDWSSSAPNVATVDASGKITALSLGQAIIAATIEGKTAQAPVTVIAAPVATVVVSPDSARIKLTESVALSTTLRDDLGALLAGRAVRWRSNNNSVATVDSITGLVAAVDAGVATITATSETKSGSASVVVFAPVATVAIDPQLDTLEVFDTLPSNAVLRDARSRVLTGRVVRWTSSNPAVASIDSVSGRLIGVDRGTVTITATSEGKSGSATRVVVIKYRSIAAGTMHACDIASGGIAWCWGLNGAEGRLGSSALGTHANQVAPFAVPGGHRFAQLVTFARTTCGITRSGETYCWGYNGFGALGAGGASAFSAVPVRVGGGHAFVKLAAGTDFACGLDAIGAMYCWGFNGWAQFGNNTTAQATTPVAAAPGMVFSALAAGSTHVCGVAASGTYCWGADGQGQVGDGAVPSGGNTTTRTPKLVTGGHLFQTLALGNLFSCARNSSGQAYCWGNGQDGVLGSNRNTNTSTPLLTSGALAFQSLSAGYSHACGVATGGALYCWGANRSGQLGAGSAGGSSVPQRVSGFLAVEVAAAGIGTGSGAHSCAISSDRLTVRCWGQNDEGQLGNGTTTPASVLNIVPSVVIGQRPL